MRESKRAFNDVGDQVWIRKSSPRSRGSVFGIPGKIRVWIYVDDVGDAGRVDTKIDARIATESEQGPAGPRGSLEHSGQLWLVLFQTEASYGADVGRAVGRPFAIVSIDLGFAGLYALKQDLDDRSLADNGARFSDVRSTLKANGIDVCKVPIADSRG